MKHLGREKRHKRIIGKLRGSLKRPRVVVFRSKKHIYAQLIDDESKKVITGFSTLSKEFKEKKVKSTNKDAAKIIGQIFARRAKELGIEKISFDRAGYKYHGRVKSFADGAKEGGLKF